MKSTHHTGFTLLEVAISSGILVIISLLMYSVIRASVSAQAVAEAEEMAQASARNVLTAMAQEIEVASKFSDPSLTPPLEALTLVSPTEVVFQVPLDGSGAAWSNPITYRYVNEDAGEHEGANNAMLDDGEDLDEDGALTRRVVRIQGDDERIVGGANDISFLQFALSDNNDVLTITVAASKQTDLRRRDLATATASTSVYLQN